MSRLVGMVLFILIVMAGVGGYHGRAQENKTLEQRIMTLESQMTDLRGRESTLADEVASLQTTALPPPNPAVAGLSDEIDRISMFDPDYVFGIVCRDGGAKTGATLHACIRVPYEPPQDGAGTQ